MREIRRLSGEKDSILSGFYKNPLRLVRVLLTFSIGIYIITLEFGKLGTQKAKTVEFNGSMKFQYHYSDALPLHGVNWFYVDSIFTHI